MSGIAGPGPGNTFRCLPPPGSLALIITTGADNIPGERLTGRDEVDFCKSFTLLSILEEGYLQTNFCKVSITVS